ncbi:MAG: hypothetical protein IJ075_01660 [Lachnospiraceae bacterium]|nr:hypothetical protein [Lachnospiraceae bacterium]MBQ9605744.1 hypothetical protein [Lachnospiraceae bacterium]MBR1524123.1 hypothetical protein [Lachnospiraceae bacterium]
MSEVSKLNDEQLESVSGGAGKTKWGYNYDDKGTVTFADKTGASIKISAADWKWLLGKYNGPIEDPEYYLSTVPVKDVSSILDQHHAGTMK